VVSDVHGTVDALATAADGADALVCLGDLILYLDYDDPAQGVFGELFGAPAATEFIRLRLAGEFDRARAFAAAQWERLGGDRASHLERKVREQCEAMFAVMRAPTYLTYGNVDVPAYWSDHLRPGQQVLDGETVELDGLRFGFVGGGLRTPYRTPYELDDDVFADRVAALGPVDVLCTHIPPAIPQITYGTVARRFERGSAALTAYVLEHRPRLLLHGHVHQPLVARTRIGRTEVVNVGHFRGTRRPFELRW
jgi:Icc-related predicted phosphoesterase